MKRDTRRMATLIVIAVIQLLAGSRGAFAQTMSFSMYTDASMDEGGSTIYSYNTISDNSSGCTHGNYNFSGRLYSPGGREVYGSGSGLQTSASISLNEEYGEYTALSMGTYTCSCMQYQPITMGISTKLGAGRFAYILDYIHWYGVGHYVRCNPGSQCREMDALKSRIIGNPETYPLYLMMKNVWVNPNACAGFDLEEVPVCVADNYPQ